MVSYIYAFLVVTKEMKYMRKSQKLTTSLLLIGCIAYSLIFSDPVDTALSFTLYACILMYLFSNRKLPVFSRIKIMIAAFMFSIVMTAVCVTAAELLRGYFLFESVFMGCMMCLALGAVIQLAFLIMQEFLPDAVQIVLLVLAGLYLLDIGVFSATMQATLSDIGLTARNTQYTLPWNLLGISLGIVLAEAALFAGVYRLRLYFQNR